MNKGEGLSVIIICYNRLEYTKRTLESLIATVPKAKFIIFDNGSLEPGMQDWLELLTFTRAGQVADLCVVQSTENMGWGKAVNNCLKDIEDDFAICSCGNKHDFKTPFLLLSNNDVEYSEGWYDKCLQAYEKYPQIGILGVWQHTAHGIKERKEDLLIKDDMPAVGWLVKPEILKMVGPFAEKGPCLTKGGNGEDSNYAHRVQERGFWTACFAEDVATHFDGY